MPTFFVENFGCRASQADGAALESLLQQSGLHSTSLPSADLIVINTCTVTASADTDIRASIRRAHRENNSARILVTGCYAERAPEDLASLPGVEWVVGNGKKAEIPGLVSPEPYHSAVHTGKLESAPWLAAPQLDAPSGHARPNLKIQDGCSNRCSFCIIPSVRGRSRYLPADRVVEVVRDAAERYPEIVLTGINLGRWGRGAAKEGGSPMRLADLLGRLLDETAVHRIRLSSVEPMDWSDDLIGLMAGNSRIAPHVHMPLQSGADRVLRAMRRKYRPLHYADRLLRAFRALPDAAFGADVMTGFPGETDELFEESRAFIEDLPFTYLHVFTYSERPGTEAVRLAGSVPVEVRRERNRILRELSAEKNRAFRIRMMGRQLPAVTLEEQPVALTANFLRVEMNGWPGANQGVHVRPDALTASGMRERSLLPIL